MSTVAVSPVPPPPHRVSLRHALRSTRPWALFALALGVAGCGDDHHCWRCGPSGPATEVSYGLVGADFTGSGLTSIVQTSTVHKGNRAYPGYLKAYLATGPGAFAAPALTNGGGDPLYLATADLNGDGLPDIVSASYQDGALAVFFDNAQSPGSFNTPLVLNSPGASQVAIGDVNGDGLADLVSADYNVSLFVQTSPGTFANPVSLYSGGANWVAVGDLNGDGIADVALTDNVGVKVLLHTGVAGTMTFAAPVSVYTETASHAVVGANLIAIADVNGDGSKDLILSDPGPKDGSAPSIVVLLQDATHPGTFLPGVSYPTTVNSLPVAIEVADVNADGHPDIIVGGTNSIDVLLQATASPGSFLAATSYAAYYANELAIADVNADGLLDIVTTSGASSPVQNGIVTNPAGVLLQNATVPGTFTAVQDLP